MEQEATTTASEVSLAVTSTLSPEEQKIVYRLLNARETANQLIPDDIEPGQLWLHLGATCKALQRIKDATSKLKPLLGRMFMMLQKYPALYQQQGYANYNDFMSKGAWDLFGISRPEAYNSVRLIEELGSTLTTDEMVEIGTSNLNLAASAIRQETQEGTPPEKIEERRRYWIEAAKSCTVDELRKKIYNESKNEPGSLEMRNLVIYATKAQADHVDAFLANVQVHAFVGSASPGDILEMAVAEAETEWVTRANEAEKEKLAIA